MAPQISEDDQLALLQSRLDLGVELAGELDALDVVDDPEIDRVAGHQEHGSPTNSCMTK